MFGGAGGGWGKLFCLLSGFNFYENTLTLNFPKCKDASMVVSHNNIGNCVNCILVFREVTPFARKIMHSNHFHVFQKSYIHL